MGNRLIIYIIAAFKSKTNPSGNRLYIIHNAQ